MVADGMGGQAAGDVASALFASCIKERLGTGLAKQPGTIKEYILESFRNGHDRILEKTRTDPQCRGMGCTADLLVITGDHYTIGHIGDSRIYRLREGNLEQLTKDHSFVQFQVDSGVISKDQARSHHMRNILMRAVGMKDDFTVDILEGEVQSGDLFLLCTDGLYSMLEEEKIKDILKTNTDPDIKTSLLVNLANGAGGHDNITVIIVEIPP